MNTYNVRLTEREIELIQELLGYEITATEESDLDESYRKKLVNELENCHAALERAKK